jgi:hypothetical protein
MVNIWRLKRVKGVRHAEAYVDNLYFYQIEKYFKPNSLY